MTDIANIAKVCQKCRKEEPSTRPRSVRMPEFIGPCSEFADRKRLLEAKKLTRKKGRKT